MGEIADMILDGILCQTCGALVDEQDASASGYPRDCDSCKDEENEV